MGWLTVRQHEVSPCGWHSTYEGGVPCLSFPFSMLKYVYILWGKHRRRPWNDGNSEAISTWCLPWLICATTNTNYTVYSLTCDLSLPRLYLTIQRLNKRNLDFRPALKHRTSPVQLNEVAIPYTGLEEFIFSSSTPESGRWHDQGSCPQLAPLASEGEEYT